MDDCKIHALIGEAFFFSRAPLNSLLYSYNGYEFGGAPKRLGV